ncbi:MAG: hypothetical protein PHN82_00790 [bacterium]|nr:hypothetical protein [bacterium]
MRATAGRPGRTAARLLKGAAFCAVFIALCAAATLGAMRLVASRSGRADLFGEWVEDIRDAFGEAGRFVRDLRRRPSRGGGTK